MTTETTKPTTTAYPWDRTEPYEPWVPVLSASLVVVRATPIGTFDFAAEGTGYRVSGLHVGDISLHIGGSGGDRELIAVADRLIEALLTLRDAAVERMDVDR